MRDLLRKMAAYKAEENAPDLSASVIESGSAATAREDPLQIITVSSLANLH